MYRYEGALDPWLSSLWNMLYQLNPSIFPKGPDFVTPDENLVDLPKVRIMYHDVEEVNSQFSIASGNLFQIIYSRVANKWSKL